VETTKMLVALLGAAAAAYAPAHRVMPAHAVVSSTTRAAVSMADDSLLQSMSDSFYANKRARLESELAARLSELEEYEARERALIDMSGPAIGAAGGSAGLLAELEAEKAKTAALEAALAQQKLDSEVALQKVAAYWVAKLDEAKLAPALAAAGEPAVAAAAAAPAAEDLVPTPKEFLDPDLSLRELRVRLLTYGLSTTGIKSELRSRLEEAMLMGRQQFKSWDPVALQWK